MCALYLPHPLLLLCLAVLCFFFAICQRPGRKRRFLQLGHVAGILIALGDRRIQSFPVSELLAPMIFGLGLHTSSLLFLDHYVLTPVPASLSERIKAVYSIFGDVRRHTLGQVKSPGPNSFAGNRSRARFAIIRSGRVVILWLGSRAIINLVLFAIVRFRITLDHLAPDKRGILTDLSPASLVLRTIMSGYWIWSTFALLTAAHDILSILFVSLLRWDNAEDWPVLFCNITEAYSLTRFWGIFWHRLHVPTYEAYMPTTLKRSKGLRAFWMFLMSALSHATVHYLTTGKESILREARFFLWNYIICTAERFVGGAWIRARFSLPRSMVQICGYVWVFAVFFSLTPAWQYPSLYDWD